jgi:uncharacterized protein YcbK (DUF882 family)
MMVWAKAYWSFFSRVVRGDSAGIVTRILILVVVSIGLNACVSHQAPNVSQVERQLGIADQNTDPTDQSSPAVMAADIGKQKLLPVTNGTQISVPQSNPLKSSSAQLALINQTTVPDSANIENINKNRNRNLNKNFSENVATDNNIVSTDTPQNISAKQPVIGQSPKKPKPNLLALLFQGNAKKKNVVNQPVNAVAVVNVNQITKPVDGVVVPSVRPVQSGELVLANNSSVDNNLSTPEISNDNQTINNPVRQNSTANKQNDARKKPGFFALLLQRNKKNMRIKPKLTDDRHNSILLSSRTSSRANRVTAAPITAGLANISNVINDQNNKNIQLASAAGLSRNAVNGIVTQHSGVSVDCITPGVVRIMQYVEQRYGNKPVVTSGYRSPSRNRRAGGARNSMHIYCRAVDIQVKGVSKWHLAKFLRTVPGRGGVGTYCRTNSVHIDTGPKRDWHYPCRRKTKRRRKS